MKFINASQLDSESIYTTSYLFPGNVLLMINIFSFEYHDVNDNTATVYKH